MAQDVFDHYHRSVDDHAEVERAQRKQIGGNVTQVEQNRGEQKGEGNGDGDDQRAAYVAEKQKQNQRHQQHAVGQIAQDRVSGVVHQFAAVEVRNKLHALRQQGRSFSWSIFSWSASSVVSATAPLRSRTMPSTTSSLLTIVPSSLRMVFAELAEANFRGLNDRSQDRERAPAFRSAL